MGFTFLGIEPSGNAAEFIVRVRRQPSWFERLLGDAGGQTSYYGPRPAWVRMDGQAASRGEQRALETIWQRYGAQAVAQENPWLAVEPGCDLEHSQMPGRAVGVRPNENRMIANATGVPLRQ